MIYGTCSELETLIFLLMSFSENDFNGHQRKTIVVDITVLMESQLMEIIQKSDKEVCKNMFENSLELHNFIHQEI